MGEKNLLRWLQQHDPATTRLIGDDAALLPPSGSCAVTMDSQIEGVHFFSGLEPTLLARRLLAVNLSDLAAVGAIPALAFLALSAPATFDHRSFFSAFTEACRLHGVQLAGGDLATSTHIHATLTLIGDRPPGGRWLRRDQARPGDRLWVGGSLGESALGLRLLERGDIGDQGAAAVRELPPDLHDAARRAVRRHLEPQAQLELGQWLARRRRAAGMDVSDGLALDLSRLCEASEVGARLDLASVPVPSEFEPLCRALEVDPEAMLLGGGEDYVLLFTLPPGVRTPPFRDCQAIGDIVEFEGSKKPPSRIELRGLGGGPEASGRYLESIPGWDHLATEPDLS